MATIITAENFGEELTPFPGWVLRNLMLLRHLDDKEMTAKNQLLEAHSRYLREQQAIPPKKRVQLTAEELADEDLKNANPLFQEIVKLQRRVTSLSHEKLAVVAKLESLVKGTLDNLIQAASSIPAQNDALLPNSYDSKAADSRRRQRSTLPQLEETLPSRNQGRSTSTVQRSTTNALNSHVASTGGGGRRRGGSFHGGGSDIVIPSSNAPLSSTMGAGGGFGGAVGGSSVVGVGVFDEFAGGRGDGGISSASCPVCSQPDDDNMVACDGCQQWYHFICAAYTPTDILGADEPFYCTACSGARHGSKNRNSKSVKKQRPASVTEL